ncbi:MAG: YcxB family protein [Pseudobutyrivibrio sp.]|nr:YcxB family protein [Pseudobutyrivibrio sp.]
MEYRYISDVQPKDLWFIAMLRTYRSFVGIINVVFTIAMVMLTIRFWNTTADLTKSFMVFGCLLFPVIQPLAIYGRSVKQLENLPKYLKLAFNDEGVHVECDGNREDIKWSRITNAIKQKNMIIVMSDGSHGYMLTNRTLGDKKEEFYQYLCGKLKR